MNEPTDEQVRQIYRKAYGSDYGDGNVCELALIRAGWRAALAAVAPPSAPALDRLIPEQVRCPICQTFLDDANEAHDCVVAAAPASIATLTARDAEHNRRAKLRAATRAAVALIAERDALRAVVRAADAMRADAYQVDVSHKDENDFRWEDRPTAIALAYDDARKELP